MNTFAKISIGPATDIDYWQISQTLYLRLTSRPSDPMLIIEDEGSKTAKQLRRQLNQLADSLLEMEEQDKSKPRKKKSSWSPIELTVTQPLHIGATIVGKECIINLHWPDLCLELKLRPRAALELLRWIDHFLKGVQF